MEVLYLDYGKPTPTSHAYPFLPTTCYLPSPLPTSHPLLCCLPISPSASLDSPTHTSLHTHACPHTHTHMNDCLRARQRAARARARARLLHVSLGHSFLYISVPRRGCARTARVLPLPAVLQRPLSPGEHFAGGHHLLCMPSTNTSHLLCRSFCCGWCTIFPTAPSHLHLLTFPNLFRLFFCAGTTSCPYSAQPAHCALLRRVQPCCHSVVLVWLFWWRNALHDALDGCVLHLP